MTEPTYRLHRPEATVSVPRLDPDQQRVVDHPGGPLLVVAGPGTGKTTTLVEAVVDRIEHRGASPDQVLALTFSRKAAEQLRDRVTARLGRTTSATISSTFHSFAYGLVRRYTPTELYAGPLRLLSAAEADVLVADLLTGEQAVPWPEELQAAVGTRGFAREVAAVLARARERGLDPVDLVLRAQEAGGRLGPAYVAAGRFLAVYQDVLDWQHAIDYSDLIRRATMVADARREELRAQFRYVFVDEFQDSDPSQLALLDVLAGDGRDLVAVGDPRQSIYGFRGADVRGILDFPDRFRTAAGQPAPVIQLGTTRRFGANLLTAAQRVGTRLGVSGALAGTAAAQQTRPAEGLPPGKVEVLTCDTERAEAEHIADRLRRAHLEDGIDWGDMAVLVRSGRSTIPGLRRALAAAQVPVEVAGDDTPLVREPSVAPLLTALRAVVGLDVEDPEDPAHVHPDQAQALLMSPLAGLDATEVRALARWMRARDQEPSAQVLRRALLDPEATRGADLSAARRAHALARLLREAQARLGEGATAEEVLWVLWAGTDWPRRLRAAAVAGGRGARLAHRDLDALCALFETAARTEEQTAHKGVAEFLTLLAAQEIPSDTLADRGVRGSAVRLLTAHRAKGLEWRLVVVAHVQEEGWPDLRRRGSLLSADRIGAHGMTDPPGTAALLAEERRLFYVAITRARERLLVSAVRSADDDGDQPSRFLGELGLDVTHLPRRPRRPLSLAGMIAELRRTVADPDAPESLREGAARRLAALAALRDGERAIVPQADPTSWWGTRGMTRAEEPLRPADVPITLRASALESLLQCSLRWFLDREAGGATRSTTAQGFGLLVHALADRMASGEVSGAPEDVPTLMAHVEEVWGELSFRTPWSSEQEREQVRLALHRLATWHSSPRGRTVLATEHDVAARHRLPDGVEVQLRGRVDRLETDEEGRVVVIDFKTGKYLPTGAAVEAHDQLGFYQLAIEAGGVDDLLAERGAPAPGRAGGAELVQLRNAPPDTAKVQRQAPLERSGDDPLWIEERVMRAVSIVRDEEFTATPGDHCRWCPFQRLCPAHTTGTVLS